VKVKLLDLSEQHATIEREAMREIKKVCAKQSFVLGENVRELEAEIAKYTGARFAVGVSSGSDALVLALMALGVKAGDLVATTPYTFFSTAGSISILGAVPVFVDIDERTYNMDAGALERVLKQKRGRVKAVIPVHLYGQCADMQAIKKVARKHGAKVIEDAAQSIGSLYKEKGAGSIGDIGCFSFYPTKNLGCFGDGGMVTTNSKTLFEKLKMLRVHGSRVRYSHELIGMNGRLDEIQAAVLRVKLKKLPKWTKARQKNADNYMKLFTDAGLLSKIMPPFIAKGNESVYNQYVVRAKKRDKLRAHLTKKNVGTDIYYPIALHMQKCFKELGYKRGDFPVSEKAAKETLALPIYPELKKTEQEYVVKCIKGFYK
jgi:dTDP-4-amino-4,6-dideoxygalactose transaminase